LKPFPKKDLTKSDSLQSMISFYEKYNLDISNLLNVDFLTLPEEDITNVMDA